jgi:hypothetical protein
MSPWRLAAVRPPSPESAIFNPEWVSFETPGSPREDPAAGERARGAEFQVSSFGFRVFDLRFRISFQISNLELINSLERRERQFEFSCPHSPRREEGPEVRGLPNFEFRISDFGFRVSSFEFRIDPAEVWTYSGCHRRARNRNLRPEITAMKRACLLVILVAASLGLAQAPPPEKSRSTRFKSWLCSPVECRASVWPCWSTSGASVLSRP